MHVVQKRKLPLSWRLSEFSHGGDLAGRKVIQKRLWFCLWVCVCVCVCVCFFVSPVAALPVPPIRNEFHAVQVMERRGLTAINEPIDDIVR